MLDLILLTPEDSDAGGRYLVLCLQPITDGIGQANRDHLSEQILAVAGEMNLPKKVFFACHDVTDLERSHDLPKRCRVHVTDIATLQVKLDMRQQGMRIQVVLQEVAVAILLDEVTREIENIWAHFYLLSRDFPLPRLDHSSQMILEDE